MNRRFGSGIQFLLNSTSSNNKNSASLQRIFRDLDSPVYGVRHAAKTVDPMAISFHPLLDRSIQVIPIFVIKENVLPAISA
jgi:hypothetical protein